MNEYTTATEQVRGQYTREDPPPIATMGEKRAEFDRWLERTLQEARDEAWDEGASIMRDIYGDPMDPNPYRKETDA